MSDYDLLSGFAVDPKEQQGFLLVGQKVSNMSLSILTIDLNSGKITSLSQNNVTYTSGSQILDLQYDSTLQTLYSLTEDFR